MTQFLLDSVLSPNVDIAMDNVLDLSLEIEQNALGHRTYTELQTVPLFNTNTQTNSSAQMYHQLFNTNTQASSSAQMYKYNR